LIVSTIWSVSRLLFYSRYIHRAQTKVGACAPMPYRVGVGDPNQDAILNMQTITLVKLVSVAKLRK